MMSRILIVISVMIILAGLIGVRGNGIRKKLVFLSISEIGSIALAFVQMGEHGWMGGIRQTIFRMPALLIFVLMLNSICKKNGIVNVTDENGFGRKMPYLYAVLVVLAAMLVGVPGTGTFHGMLYSEVGLWVGEFGLFMVIGTIGNLFSIIVPAWLAFPILKHAYFPEAADEKALMEMRTEQIAKPGKVLCVLAVLVAVFLMVACIFQNELVTKVAGMLPNIVG